jgi:formylglycine-generating enzyme required for sulfatase activity
MNLTTQMRNRCLLAAGLSLSMLFSCELRPSWSAPESESQAAAPRATDVLTNSIGMKLVRIPPGKFIMGSPRNEAERESDEPAHEVSITKSFHMGVYEVTQAEYAQVMGPKFRAVFTDTNRGGPNHPVENLEWNEAAAFCKTLTDLPAEKEAGRKYRLPTEAEWEYACRAGTTTPFHFGESLSAKQANFNGNHPYGSAESGPYLRRTAKVGSYAPNAFGLFDMHGNVAEWCADWYDPNYYNDSPDDDPLGPPAGALADDFGNFYLSVRGGSWIDDARACRSANRFRAMHRNRYWFIGFRVVCEMTNAK